MFSVGFSIHPGPNRALQSVGLFDLFKDDVENK